MKQRIAGVCKNAMSLFAAAAIACALLPVAAFADDEATVYFTLSETEVSVDAGQILDVSKYVEQKTAFLESHYDYVCADSSILSGSKHEKLVTAAQVAQDTTTTVTIYLVDSSSGTTTTEAPCGNLKIYQQATLTVTVKAAQEIETVEYSAQGEDLKMELTSPSVTNATLQGNTYTNTVAAQKNKKNLVLTFKPSAGLNQYLKYYKDWGFNTPALAYRGLACRYMTYISPSGNSESASSYGGSVSVSDISSTSVSLMVPLGSETGTATLIVSGDLHTFTDGDRSTPDKYLGNTLIFKIEIVENDAGEKEVADISSAEVQLSFTKVAYNSSVQTPSVTGLKLADGTLVTTGFFASYADNVEPGTATVTVTGDGLNCAGTAVGTFVIEKAPSIMYAKAAKSTFKMNKKKAQKTSVKVYGKAGKVTYRSNSSKVKVTSKGKVTIKKGFKGKATITVTDSGNNHYKAKSYKVKIAVK